MRGGFFTSVNHDRKYNEEDFSDYFSQFLSNGVFFSNGGNGMFVAADGTMTLTIRAGHCFIGGRMGITDGTDTVTIGYGTSNTRYDRVVIRCDYAERRIYPAVIVGSDNGTVPPVVRNGTYYDIGLAVVTVAPSATAITQAAVEDTRGNQNVCGFVRQNLDTVNEGWLFEQFRAFWNAFVAQLGESDHITIETFDLEALGQVKSQELKNAYGKSMTW